jgi:hypothetical protein
VLHSIIHTIGVINKNNRPVAGVNEVRDFEWVCCADSLAKANFEEEFTQDLDKTSGTLLSEYDGSRLQRHVRLISRQLMVDPWLQLISLMVWAMR